MSLITISDLTMEYGPDTILENVSLSVARGERIGIVGRNGGGKTTLLKAILGIEQPASGNIHIAKGIRIGYLSQIQSVDESQTVIQAAEVALSAVADAETELRIAEQALAENPTDEELTEALGAAQDRHQYLGGHFAVDGLHALWRTAAQNLCISGACQARFSAIFVLMARRNPGYDGFMTPFGLPENPWVLRRIPRPDSG